MGNLTYNLFGNTLLDAIFTLIIKGFLFYLIILIIFRIAKTYTKGDIPELIVNVIVGLAILGFIIGIDNVVWMGKQIKELFPGGSGGTGGGGSAPAVQ